MLPSIHLYVLFVCLLADPKVQVYSYSPGEFGKENVLICHVSGFHPPDITIELLKNGVEIPDAQQTDLAFEKGWKFHLTRSAPFTPQKHEDYACRVRHVDTSKTFMWGKATFCLHTRNLKHVFGIRFISCHSPCMSNMMSCTLLQRQICKP